MAVTSKRKVNAEQFKSKVKEFWEITDHRPIKWFLGFQIKRDTISTNQQAYINSIVEKFRLMSAKQVTAPMEANALFSTQQSPSSLNQVECMKGSGFSEELMVIFVLFTHVWVPVSSLYCPIGRDPFCVRVAINLCKFGACFCHLRRLIQIPMSLQ